jgi:hypothetical protein
MTDLPIYQVVQSDFGENYEWFVLPLHRVTRPTLINIEYQLTRDQWDVFFDQLNMIVQNLVRNLQSHFPLRKDSHWIDNIGI